MYILKVVHCTTIVWGSTCVSTHDSDATAPGVHAAAAVVGVVGGGGRVEYELGFALHSA